METRMFLCLHVKNLHESTKTCVHYIVTDKGLLLISPSMSMVCVPPPPPSVSARVSCFPCCKVSSVHVKEFVHGMSPPR